MSIDSNSKCVRSKYFTDQTDMDGSLSDFKEAKKSCKGPKSTQKPAKPKTKKVTKRIKGQKDIRTALKGKKNEIVTHSKEFDSVCKKSGLNVDPEQLQLAIALSKSLQTESNNPESSQTLSSQQRVAKIRKTLQEYGFKVPEAKITVGKKTKKHRKKYKLLTVSEQEKHQNITEKYTKILFQNLDCSRVEQDSFDKQESEARIFYVASSIPYEYMKDNNIFYVDNLVEKSITSGSLLRDWSEIPGRPESPKLVVTNMISFKDMGCSQNELDTILSAPIESVKHLFISKAIEYKKKLKECDVPTIVIDDEQEIVSEDGAYVGVGDNNSPFQEVFTMESPPEIVLDLRSVNSLFEDKSVISEEIEIVSPMKQAMVKIPEVINIDTNNLLTFNQQCRSSSPDIFDDELSSIMETTKPIIVSSQEHRTKVFSQDNYMDLTQCANFLSQNCDKGIQLSQNVTKRRSNDFMEITDCIVGSSQPIYELKEIDLIQSPENIGAIEVGDHSINFVKVSTNFSNDPEQSTSHSISQNITDEQQITVVLNQPDTETYQYAKDNIDLTQSSNEEDKEITIEEYIQTPDKKVEESLDLTQSSNSTDFDSLPLVEFPNLQSQISLDNTIIVDKDEYFANGKVIRSIFLNEVHSQVIDLTQAQNSSIEYYPSPVNVGNTESYKNSFYEDFVHDHSESAEYSKEIDQNSHLCKEQNSSHYKRNESHEDLTQGSNTSEEILSSLRPSENTVNSIDIEQQYTEMSKEHNISSHNGSKESIDDIDLTQGSSKSEEIIMSQRPVLVVENITNPNNSSLGKRDDVSIDYDEIIMEDNICEGERLKETENYSSLTHQYDMSRSVVQNDIEIVGENNDIDINSSQNSEVFQISDRELDYSLHQSRRDFPADNFNVGGISVLYNVTKLGSCRKSLSEGCLPYFTENKNDTVDDSFLPEVFVKKSEKRIIETPQFEMDKAEGISPIKIQEVFKNNNGIVNIKTPNNSEYIIKTVDVTPMADFALMSTPQRNKELDRYGLKPLKRKRAIKILTHLYNQTHPTIQQLVDEEQSSPSKKPRTNTYTRGSSPQRLFTSLSTSPSNTQVKSPTKFIWKKPTHETSPSPTKTNELERESNVLSTPFSKRTDELVRYRDVFSAVSSKNTDDLEKDRHIVSATTSYKTDEVRGVTDVCGYEVSSEGAVVKSVDCCPDDWVFQKREKSKVHSCRVPLHIAFHNYVLSRRTLREAILKYEPVNIDVIHKDLVGYGHRYDPKDLLKYLDKKCITVKTTDNNARNNKR